MTQPRYISVHRLKTHPDAFAAVWEGVKLFEVRREDDRFFNVGDLLDLREYDPKDSSYSERRVLAWIAYKAPGGWWGLPERVCVLGMMPDKMWRCTVPRSEKATATDAPGAAATGNYAALKEMWDEQCSQIADMCSYLGAHPDSPPDAWTLRDMLVKLREAAPSSCVDSGPPPDGFLLLPDPVGAFLEFEAPLEPNPRGREALEDLLTEVRENERAKWWRVIENAFLGAVHRGESCPFCIAVTSNTWPYCNHFSVCVLTGDAGDALRKRLDAAAQKGGTER